MARIFFKKEGQKPSVMATLGLITAGLALAALVIAGPVFRLGIFGDPAESPTAYDLQVKLIWVSFRLIIVSAAFTFIGILHGRFSSRARTSWRGFVAAIMAAAMGWPVGHLIYNLQYAPALHDISTRPDKMLRFDSLPERQYDASTPLGTLGSRLDENYLTKLHTAYPGLGSLPYPGSVREATAAALLRIEEFGWTVVKSDVENGRIEAVHTSPWFGFKSFILVEVRAMDAVSFLDIRTVSEMGHTDLGTGAKLIGALRSGLIRNG